MSNVIKPSLSNIGDLVSFGKKFSQNSLKRFITHLLLFSFLHQNLAFATNGVIELDFKDSQTPQRLHVMPRLSPLAEVSHVEIDTEKRQVSVCKVSPTQPLLLENRKDTSSVHPRAIKKHSILIPSDDIYNLPWDLSAEKLTLFLLAHTAWLSPLSEDSYKLDFKGSLLGGGGAQSTGGGGGHGGSDNRGHYSGVVNVYQGTIDCGGRHDYPSGSLGARYCNAQNLGSSGGGGFSVHNSSFSTTGLQNTKGGTGGSSGGSSSYDGGSQSLQIHKKGISHTGRGGVLYYDDFTGLCSPMMTNALNSAFQCRYDFLPKEYQEDPLDQKLIQALDPLIAESFYQGLAKVKKSKSHEKIYTQKYHERFLSPLFYLVRTELRSLLQEAWLANYAHPLMVKATKADVMAHLHARISQHLKTFWQIDLGANAGKQGREYTEKDQYPSMLNALKPYSTLFLEKGLEVFGNSNEQYHKDYPHRLVLNGKGVLSWLTRNGLVYPLFGEDRLVFNAFFPHDYVHNSNEVYGDDFFQWVIAQLYQGQEANDLRKVLLPVPHLIRETFKDIRVAPDFPSVEKASEAFITLIAAVGSGNEKAFLSALASFFGQEVPYGVIYDKVNYHHRMVRHMLPKDWRDDPNKGFTAFEAETKALAQWAMIAKALEEYDRHYQVYQTTPVSLEALVQLVEVIRSGALERMNAEEAYAFLQDFGCDPFALKTAQAMEGELMQVAFKGNPNDPMNLMGTEGIIGFGGSAGGKVNWNRIMGKNKAPVLQRQPDFKWNVKEPNVADKIVRHPKAGNVYRDPTQKIGNKEVWWSKDKGGKNAHGGEHYKLFERTSEGLQWIGDVDKTGKIMMKHKSDVGKLLLNKDLIGVK
jgi:hypothetical protein